MMMGLFTSDRRRPWLVAITAVLLAAGAVMALA